MDIEMHFHFLGFQQYELKHWFPSIRMKTLSENKTKQRIGYKFLSLIKKKAHRICPEEELNFNVQPKNVA